MLNQYTSLLKELFKHYTPVYILYPIFFYFSCLGGPSSTVLALADCARQRTQTLLLVMSEYYLIVKTFNNGSLGSGIDEERSEMR